jgi:hypothetical protein
MRSARLCVILGMNKHEQLAPVVYTARLQGERPPH